MRGWIRIHDGVIERDPNITPLIFTQVIEKNSTVLGSSLA